MHNAHLDTDSSSGFRRHRGRRRAGIVVHAPGHGAAAAARSRRRSMRFPLRLIGPSAPSGRVWNVVGVPGQPKTFYACTAEGGVWRTTNNGTTMTPIFDEENAAVVRRGGRRAVRIRTSSGSDRASRPRGNRTALGYGVYKSIDGGKTWQHLGLETTEQIGAIVIDPRDPQTVYVGAMGHLWGRNAERGVFKTTDGGRTWRKVLYVDDMTGCIDLGDRSARSERSLRDDVAASAVGRRRDARVGPGQRDLQEHRRRRALDAADERPAERAAQQDHAGGRAEDTRAGLRLHPLGRAAARRAHERRRRRLPIGGRRRQLAARQPEARLAHLLHAHQGRPVERSPPVHPRPRAVAIRRRRRELGEAQHEERPLRSSWPVDRPGRSGSSRPGRRRAASTCRSTTARAGCVQAHFGDAVDLPQGFALLVVGLVAQAAAESGDDGLARQAFAVAALHCEDEGKSELGVVAGVHFLQGREFLLGAQVQASFGLLAGGFGCQFARNGGLACQLRVSADQAQLFVMRCLRDDLLQLKFQFIDGAERALRGGALRNPRGMLVQAVQDLGKGICVAGVQSLQARHRASGRRWQRPAPSKVFWGMAN